MALFTTSTEKKLENVERQIAIAEADLTTSASAAAEELEAFASEAAEGRDLVSVERRLQQAQAGENGARQRLAVLVRTRDALKGELAQEADKRAIKEAQATVSEGLVKLTDGYERMVRAFRDVAIAGGECITADQFMRSSQLLLDSKGVSYRRHALAGSPGGSSFHGWSAVLLQAAADEGAKRAREDLGVSSNREEHRVDAFVRVYVKPK